MIKFFRKIRLRLLTENKFSKYLIYAIGEIVLVVIGILIAIAINNWNEKRKMHFQEIIYLNNIKNDIKAQIKMLNVYIDFENIIVDQSKDIIKHYELNDGFNNMDSIFPKLHDLTIRWTFSNANSTLQQLLNSNQINIIRNRQLKEELIKFNQEIDLFTKNTNINNTNLIDNLTTSTFLEIGSYALYGNSKRMMNKFHDFYSFEKIILYGFETKNVTKIKLKNISTEIINQPKNELELINKVVYRNTLSSLQKTGNQSFKLKSEQIMHKIEKEIQSHK